MDILDDNKVYEQYDPSNCYQSISQLANQCRQAWTDTQQISFPANYSKQKNIVICGMGGSAFGARIIDSCFNRELTVPVKLANGYNLPHFVDKDSLILGASYSGNTEETVAAINIAVSQKYLITGITSGGLLADILNKNNYSFYQFKSTYNPSGQPRLGQGYMIFGQLGILTKTGYLTVNNPEIDSLLEILNFLNNELTKDIHTDNNRAKTTAKLIENKMVYLLGGEFLEGSLHIFRNNLHETAKHFANYYLLPEANHHLMEGLANPVSLKKGIAFVMVNSSLYSANIKKRYNLTREVIEKNNIETIEINLNGKTYLEQNFELIMLGSYISFYLAMLHKLNPADIPWVDHFKSQLIKKS